jgi:hypothetical protein
LWRVFGRTCILPVEPLELQRSRRLVGSGWTMSVARNEAERGHYGRLLDGQLAPPGLVAAFPVTARFWSYRYEQL